MTSGSTEQEEVEEGTGLVVNGLWMKRREQYNVEKLNRGSEEEERE